MLIITPIMLPLLLSAAPNVIIKSSISLFIWKCCVKILRCIGSNM